MQISPLLSFYIGRNFLLSFVIIFAAFMGVILLFESVELMRRGASAPDVTVSLVIQMSFLKLPFMAQKIFPFAVLFGGMVAFWRLTRTRELVVTRAAGVSAWQFLLPVLTIALVMGILSITALNPLASAMLAKFDRLDGVYFKSETNVLAVSKSGLWLRQSNPKNRSVIHAPKVRIDGRDVSLTDVTIFVFDDDDKFVSRIQAETGELEDGFWYLRSVQIQDTDKPKKVLDEYWFETDLTLNNIQDSFSPPETMSFWELPRFIANLDRAGFSALRHKLYWHSLLAAPLLLCGMVLIAATFTLRPSNRSSTTFVVIGGIFSGFLLFIFSDIVFALGLRDSIPIALAAWTPSGVCTLLGLAMVFHLEDG